MAEIIEYGALMHAAMRELIAKVLRDVAKDGLPGEHHFFITFDTTHPDVAIADWLRERYPEEMTIVVQHWFDNLEVTDTQFSITLNFGDNPEPLVVPLAALKTFVDPSVEFGLRFETQDSGDDQDPTDDPDPTPEPPEPDPSGEAEIVQLDRFRK